MNRSTLMALNAINQDFYRQQADSFSRSRDRPWQGWSRVLSRLSMHPSKQRLMVLDVGCGNGRFGSFLQNQLERPVSYTGLDASQELLSEAQQRLNDPAVRLLEHDLVKALADAAVPEVFLRTHDAVVVFGLLHHIPSAACRRQLVAWCARGLKLGGLLALTCWQFGARERFVEKLVPWQQALDRYDILPSDLEVGDHLVRWGNSGALRYCHFIRQEELQTWAQLPGLRLLDTFLADGKSEDLNVYLLLQRVRE